MKKLYVLIWLFSLGYLRSYGQNLIIKGRIKCANPATNSTRGAANVIIVLGFNPVKSIFTESNERAGFFQLNTGANYRDLVDKEVAIYVVSRCENCTEIDKNQFAQYKKVFIDQRIDNGDTASYYMILKKDWKILKRCEDLELMRDQQANWLRKIQQQPAEDIKNNRGSLLLGSPALTALLTNLVTVVPAVNFGTFRPILLGQGKIAYGNYLFNSSLFLSANTGFNFAPSRDMSEATLWNSSAIAFARKKSNISLITNVKNNIKFSAYTKFGKLFSVGVGAIYTRQDQFRSVTYANIDDQDNKPKIDSVQMKLNEYAFYLTPSVKLSSRASLGASIKSIHQDFTIPKQLDISQDNDGNAINTFADSLVKKQSFDVDISATYLVTNYLQVGLTVMNLLGTQLYSDAFLPNQSISTYRNQTALGVGISYKVWRFNFGSDVLFNKNNFYDASFGINFVPFNNWLLSGGYALKQQSYSISLRVRHFRIAYVNDNNLMVNEVRKPISPIFNGRIYGGFSFDF